MNIIRYQKITQSIVNKRVNLLAITRTKKTKSCEERDCCGNLIDDCMVPDVVVERDCCPPSFYTWKPKIPDLKRKPRKTPPKKPVKKTKCYAGMKAPKTLADYKKEREECAKKCLNLPPICPPKQGKLKPPPAVQLSKHAPISDWDMDGHLD